MFSPYWKSTPCRCPHDPKDEPLPGPAVCHHSFAPGDYRRHYQRADGRRVFRYDNAPHYPDLPGFPAHKHEDDWVVPAPAPDLSEVLQEIDGHLYPSG